ncbi:MAG TPA: hypothetical protein VKE41_20465 [Roseiflexaceae bacterium]|nr:hypothetical protein [Roseiflexaceae bacterium]
MVTHDDHQRDGFKRRLGAIMLLVMLLLVGGAPGPALAAGPGAFVLPARGSVVIRFVAFCRDFGGRFPRAIGLPASDRLAPAQVRGALGYIRDNGLAQSGTALQSQYAIWELQGVSGLPTDNATSQAVLGAADTPPGDPANASSIAEEGYLSGAWTLELLSWKPQGNPVKIAGGVSDFFYGVGELRVRSHIAEARTLYFPTGLTFPPAKAGSQRATGYATSVSGAAGRLPTTSAGDLAPLLGLLLVGCAGGLHLWRMRRDRALYRLRLG